MNNRDSEQRKDAPSGDASGRRHTRATDIDELQGSTSSGRPIGRRSYDEHTRLIERALDLLETRHVVGEALGSAEDTHAYLRLRLARQSRELFGALFLDTRHRVLSNETLFAGSVDAATVHLRVIIQRALALNAAALIVYHNHPSGAPEPSSSDRILTSRL